MAYTRINFVDRDDSLPNSYLVDGTATEITKNNSGLVTAGTDLNATNLNQMDEGIDNAHTDIATNTANISTNTSDINTFKAFGSIVTVASSRTLALTDANDYLRVTGTTVTITVPTNASVAFDIGTEISVIQTTTGTCTFAASGGVTINSRDSNVQIDGQYGAVTLKKVNTDEWDLVGALA